MDKVEHHGTGDLDLHRPNGAVWPGSPIPAARPALVWAIPALARRYSPSTSRPSAIHTANLLAPFALQKAFPTSDYFETSAPPDGHQPTTSLPATALAGQQEGRPRVVPTFTTNRSTREMPSYTPAASPQVRRSLSSWPPHRFVHPGSGVARHVFIADAHGAPTQIHQVRVGSTLTGLHALVPLVHLLVSLAGPAPSGSADAPRRCQDCFLPSPASPGSGCPQLQPGCCDSPAARAFHPYSVTLAPRGARTDHQTGDQNPRPPNGATWSASVVPSERPKLRWANPRRRHSPARLRPSQSLLARYAAALPHVASSPGLGVLRRLRPVHGLQPATRLSPPGGVTANGSR